MGVVITAPENKPLDAPNVGKIHLLKAVRFRVYALDEVGIRIINPSEFPVFDKELVKGFQIQPFNSVTALESSEVAVMNTALFFLMTNSLSCKSVNPQYETLGRAAGLNEFGEIQSVSLESARVKRHFGFGTALI